MPENDEFTEIARSGGSGGGGDLKNLLQKLGVDESVIDTWQTQAKRAITQKLESGIDNVDVKDALEKAKEYASMSSDKMKKIAANNPKTFYAGLAAVLVGAGLLTSAVRGGSASKRASSGGGRGDIPGEFETPGKASPSRPKMRTSGVKPGAGSKGRPQKQAETSAEDSAEFDEAL